MNVELCSVEYNFQKLSGKLKKNEENGKWHLELNLYDLVL